MHPTEKLINIRIQTSGANLADMVLKLFLIPAAESVQPLVLCTGEITPNEALREACQNLKHICSRMREDFLQEMSQVSFEKG